MSTKTSKPKLTSLNGNTSTNGTSAKGASTKVPKRKKSMYEKWIEKYGVDESESANAAMEIWRIAYESHNRRAA